MLISVFSIGTYAENTTSGFKDGKSVSFENAMGAQMSDNGKVVLWYGRDQLWKTRKFVTNLEMGKMFTISDKGAFQILYNISSDGKVILWGKKDEYYVQNITPLIKRGFTA